MTPMQINTSLADYVYNRLHTESRELEAICTYSIKNNKKTYLTDLMSQKHINIFHFKLHRQRAAPIKAAKGLF